MTPVNALKSAFEMRMHALEMVEADARTREKAMLMGERIHCQSELTQESLQLVLCKMREIRKARSHKPLV